MDGERVSHRLGALQKTSPGEECRELPAIQAVRWHAGGTRDTTMTHTRETHLGEKSTSVPAAPVNHLCASVSERQGEEKKQKTNVSCQQLHTKLINGVPAVGDPQRDAFKKSSPILPNIKLSAVF